MFQGHNIISYSSDTSDVCPICGNEVPAGELFCERCGMRIYAHQLQDFHKEVENNNTMHSTTVDKQHPSVATYGLHTLSESPNVKAVIDSCKEKVSATYPDISRLMDDYRKRVLNEIKDIVIGDAIDISVFESLGINFFEERDFGLDRCTEAANEIFNPCVIMSWANLSEEKRRLVAGAYAKEVAVAFELVLYKGVIYEDMEENVWGCNRNGDGVLYLANALMDPIISPLLILDTITHELRHQYQRESVWGYHNVSEDVINEWKIAFQFYTTDAPSCDNPWGYHYSAIEIDARYAGETVVRNVTHDLFNLKSAVRQNAISIQKLKKRLFQEGYRGALLEQTAGDLLKLDGEAADMLHSWIDFGTKPEFGDIEGLNSSILRNHYKMKDPAIILSYGMLMNNPVRNGKYLKSLLNRQISTLK